MSRVLFYIHFFCETVGLSWCYSADFARGHGFPHDTSSSTNAPTYFKPLAFPTTSFYAVMLTLEEENALFLSGFPLTLLILCFFVGQRRSEENEGEIKEEIPTRFYFCVHACFLFKIERQIERQTDSAESKKGMDAGRMDDG